MTTYALPIVVRVEKNFYITAEAVYKATILGVVDFLEQTSNSEVNQWLQSDYRKVVRRARGTKWDDIKEHALTIQRSGDVEIAVLDLHDINQTPDYLRKLQVSGLELPSKTFDIDNHSNNSNILNIYVNKDINMSTGKTVAQIGHAAQLVYQNTPKNTLTQWKKNPLINFHKNPPENTKNETLKVVDNGLTEIPSGTTTVTAWWE